MGTDIARMHIRQPVEKEWLFQKGHPRYGGRRKGSRNKFGDIRESTRLILMKIMIRTVWQKEW
jgi:hypothetical protein